jgi:Tol biopolymer transport system component
MAPAPAPDAVRITSDMGLTCSPALSPDGKLVAYASDRSSGENLDIWVQTISSGEAMQKTRSAADEESPRFSPDGNRIVFERAGAGIFSMPTLGQGERLLAAGGLDPQFSPDGTQVAYWVGDRYSTGATGAIFVAPIAEGAPRRIAAEFAGARIPLWQPGGKHLLFEGVRSPQDEPEWWVVPVNGGPAVKTGILAALRSRGLTTIEGPGDWKEDHLVFSAKTQQDSHIWYVTLKPPGWQPGGLAAQLTPGTGIEGEPALAPGSRAAFSGFRFNNNLWRLAIGEAGSRQSKLERLSETGAIETRPSICADGKKLAFLARRSDHRQVWIRDLPGGSPRELTVGPDEKTSPVIAPDGSRVAYSVVGKPSIYIVPTDSSVPGVASKACENCGEPADWTSDGGILYANSRSRCIELFDPGSGTASSLLCHPQWSLDQPRVSPDNRWIAFVATTGLDRTRILVAPFQSGTAPGPDSWIAVTGGEAWDDKPRWLNGDSLLFYSRRDDFGCLWKQQLDAKTRRPVGAPVDVYHFHTLRLSPRTLYRHAFEFAVARDHVFLNLVEICGNVWMTKIPAR